MSHLKFTTGVSTVLACAMFFNSLSAEEVNPVKSGLPTGTRLVPFQVKDCTGPASGKSLCYFCRYGLRPVIGIFTREINSEVVELLKKTEQAVADNRDQRMAAFLVFVSADTADAERKLKQLAKNESIRLTPLTILKEPRATFRQNYQMQKETGLLLMTWRNAKVIECFESEGAKIASIRLGKAITTLAKTAQED
ncbi:MAG: hypothetical protein ACI9G1_003129 [Pirellulaceae bacterium]|jgi:hypothetical protein